MAEEFGDWLSPRRALELVNEYYNDIGLASRAILGRLQGTTLLACGSRGTAMGLVTAVIPSSHWSHLADKSEDWWATGDVRVYFTSTVRGGGGDYRHIDVRLDPAGIQAMIKDKSKILGANAPPAAPIEQPILPKAPSGEPLLLVSIDPKDRRGPSPKAFWDDMLMAMFRRIHVEGWQPARLAEIEHAMHDWLAVRGKTAGERTIRNIAKKLLEALKD